jgi:hypothetical protein
MKQKEQFKRLHSLLLEMTKDVANKAQQSKAIHILSDFEQACNVAKEAQIPYLFEADGANIHSVVDSIYEAMPMPKLQSLKEVTGAGAGGVGGKTCIMLIAELQQDLNKMQQETNLISNGLAKVSQDLMALEKHFAKIGNDLLALKKN